jgi:hypothetical protein
MSLSNGKVSYPMNLGHCRDHFRRFQRAQQELLVDWLGQAPGARSHDSRPSASPDKPPL